MGRAGGMKIEVVVMAHLALYREWRPQDWRGVVGQAPVLKTLQNAISQDRIAHAYLFCGPRGTGKTSVAKILAKALNCEHREGTEPCNVCSRCQRITAGSSLDVLEIDAASNRGIDEIRDLRDKVRFAPTEGRYKVYIIDEVHMLTTEAFNALLKTLEEPPAHVVFLLATTEPHKLPLTILSRCQRFDFRRLTAPEVAERLRAVAAHLKLSVEEAAINLIARSAEGSLRDALGLMEQGTAFGGDKLTAADLLILLGTVSADTKLTLADYIRRREVGPTLRLLHEIVNSGKDLKEFILDMLDHYRQLLLVQTCGADSPIWEADAADRERLVRQAGEYPPGLLLHCIDALAEAENGLRLTTQPRVLVEAALLRLCSYVPGAELPEIVQRLERLEQAVTTGSIPAAAAPKVPQTRPERIAPAGSTAAKAPPREAPAPIVAEPVILPTTAKSAKEPDLSEASEPAPPADPVAPLTLARVTGEWGRILDGIKKTRRPVHALLVEGQPVDCDGSTLTLSFKYPFHKEQIEKPENRQVVEQTVRNVLKAQLRVVCIIAAPPTADSLPPTTAPGEDPKVAEADTDQAFNASIDIFGGHVMEND